MTRITSYTQLPTFEIAGNALNIYWDEQPVEPTEESPEPAWSYNIVRAKTTDDYATLVQKIIRSRYTLDDELAAINDSGRRHTEFLYFRQIAKQLALKESGELPAPNAVTMRQARLALLNADMLDQIDAAIAAIPDDKKRKAVEIEWEYAQVIDRDSPMLLMFASQLEMTDEQIDDFFRAAFDIGKSTGETQ